MKINITEHEAALLAVLLETDILFSINEAFSKAGQRLLDEVDEPALRRKMRVFKSLSGLDACEILDRYDTESVVLDYCTVEKDDGGLALTTDNGDVYHIPAEAIKKLCSG